MMNLFDFVAHVLTHRWSTPQEWLRGSMVYSCTGCYREKVKF